MQKTKLMFAVLGALSAMPALAADAAAPAPAFTPSANVAIVSNYLYRGLTQTGENPAIQGGFDLAHASGAYIGVWGSSISWISDASSATSAGTEFDTYLGYKFSMSDVGFDLGFLRYNYPGDYGSSINASTNEYYVAVSYSFLSAKVSHSTTNLFGVADSAGSNYGELNASYALDSTGVTLGAHYGHQSVASNATSDANTPLEYSDYKVSVSKDFSGYAVGLAYGGTNAGPATYTAQNKIAGKNTFVLSLSRAF